jgi:CBS domain containing-hemolysin-like protein
MTPIEDLVRVEVNQKLDFAVLMQIFNSGYSRIPCYDAKKKSDPTIGLLFVKVKRGGLV